MALEDEQEEILGEKGKGEEQEVDQKRNDG